MPLVSVIIPTYNRAHIVTDAIDSVLNQTFKDFEIIVADDGSTDNTREVLSERYSNKIHYLYSEHQGMPQRNAGIKNAKGQYLAFLDSDDIWLPGKLGAQVELITKASENVGLVYCSACYKERNKSTLKLARHRGDVLKNLLLELVITGSASSALIRRECFEKVGLFDETLSRSEDPDMWIRIALHYHVDYVCAPLVIIRHLDEHLMLNIKRVDNMDIFLILEKLFNDPHCPDDIRRLKNKAYAARILDFIGGYYSENSISKVWEYFFKGLFYDPTAIKLKHIGLFLKIPLRKLFRKGA